MSKSHINKREAILAFIKENPSASSKEIHDGIHEKSGYATVKRILQKLLSEKLVVATGRGKGTTYSVSPGYDLFQKISIENYFRKEIDERRIRNIYNFSLIKETLAGVSIFTQAEKNHLDELQKEYKIKSSRLSQTEYNKALERLAIDLSWKSSQIEGNTYSLLETERLLKEKETAAGKTREEATMLLNHKDALDFIVTNPSYINPLMISTIESIHSILIKELNVDRNIRKHIVGISGTNYKPLDNEFQIREALEDMCRIINTTENVFSKALLTLVLISYIQPFADGNKRTARIVSNAILINNKYCPLSFRTVNSLDYKKAMLIFYEQNNITAMKEIFINQFEFAVKTYF